MTACVNIDPMQLGRPETVRHCQPVPRRHKAQVLKIAGEHRCRDPEMVVVVKIPVQQTPEERRAISLVNAYDEEGRRP